jgi:hypothetical protein
MAKSQNVVSDFLGVIATPEPPLLGPQRRAGTLPAAELEQRVSRFFQSADVPTRAQPLLRSAALLWHDHLDASHTISQGIETRGGSWLHGIMHRREPDYGNAKYWFRRVGQHDALVVLGERVAALLHNNSRGLTERLIENGEWQALTFIDECERAEQGNDAALSAALRQVQAVEFNVLVEHILIF